MWECLKAIAEKTIKMTSEGLKDWVSEAVIFLTHDIHTI